METSTVQHGYRPAMAAFGAPLLALAILAGCSPRKVVTAPAQAVGQATGAVVRAAVPVAAGAAVGTVTANPAAGLAAGRAASGAVSSRSADPEAPAPEQTEEPR